jgi:hypothetical protein
MASRRHATLDLVRASLASPPPHGRRTAQNAPLFAVGYVGAAEDYSGATPATASSLGEIHIEVCTSHTEAIAGVAALMPLADSIPAELLKPANYKLRRDG